ncbi:hypothetical protein B0H16DRAFT_1581879 [Mycena metata]|uniref:Uncharacterized protein n=1 Tax=Mycena metata TaxID=1033252 RepID=A0AAD7MTS2_9AGAR|nr:hypothetical protein B0H16DRAFT_1581879 [Mycena metata]
MKAMGQRRPGGEMSRFICLFATPTSSKCMGPPENNEQGSFKSFQGSRCLFHRPKYLRWQHLEAHLILVWKPSGNYRPLNLKRKSVADPNRSFEPHSSAQLPLPTVFRQNFTVRFPRRLASTCSDLWTLLRSPANHSVQFNFGFKLKRSTFRTQSPTEYLRRRLSSNYLALILLVLLGRPLGSFGPQPHGERQCTPTSELSTGADHPQLDLCRFNSPPSLERIQIAFKFHFVRCSTLTGQDLD